MHQIQVEVEIPSNNKRFRTQRFQDRSKTHQETPMQRSWEGGKQQRRGLNDLLFLESIPKIQKNHVLSHPRVKQQKSQLSFPGLTSPGQTHYMNC